MRDALLLSFEEHREPCHMATMLEAVQACHLLLLVVPYYPLRSPLDLVEEPQV